MSSFYIPVSSALFLRLCSLSHFLNWQPTATSTFLALLFSCPVVSNSLRPHELKHTRPLWPHHLPKFAQVHVHCIGDAAQPSNALMPSSSALNLSQHQGLFQWLSCSHQSTGGLTHHQTVSGGKWWGRCAGRSGWHGETEGPLPSLRFPGVGLLDVLAA